MAEYYLRKRLLDEHISDIKIRSAGTCALDNSPVTPAILQMMKPMGISLSNHRSSPLTIRSIREADLILVMEETHKLIIEHRIPQMVHKVKFLGSYINGEDEEITDPYGGNEHIYQKSFQQIQRAVENLLKEIKEEKR